MLRTHPLLLLQKSYLSITKIRKLLHMNFSVNKIRMQDLYIITL